MYDKVLGNGYVMTVLCLMALDILLVRKLKRIRGFGKAQNWILVMLLACIFCSMSDAFCIIAGDSGIRIVNYLLNFCFNFTFCFVAYYLFEQMESTYHPERKGSLLWEILYKIPIILVTVLMLASYWTGWIFYVDDAGHYSRGALYMFFFIVLANGYTILAVLLIFSRLIREKKRERRAILWYFFSYITPIMVGTFIQVFVMQFPGSSLGLSVTMAMIFLNNQELLLNQALQDLEE